MIATSPDGQWAAVKRGREVMLLAVGAGPAATGPAMAGPATVRIDLPTDDADLVMVGSPSVLAVVTRGPAGGEPGHRIALYQPPSPDAVAGHDLDAAMRIAGLTGSRLVLVSRDGKAVTIVRIAGRALATQAIDPGTPVEFAVGLERNQVLFSLLRKLETWDAVSGRPLLRMQLPLPPPPRTVGPAHGFLWATRPGGDDILVYRMSDGRPFRHVLGVPIDDVIYHPASPLLILVTAHGLARLHCYAHSLTRIDAPWQPGMELGQLVAGEDISLLGMAEHDAEPWRVPIGGAGAPAVAIERSEMAGGDPAGAAGGPGGKAPRAIERSEMAGGDPAGAAGGPGGKAPRGIERSEMAGGDPAGAAGAAGGAGGRAPRGINTPGAAGEPVVTAADKLRAMRERSLQETLDRSDRTEHSERSERAERPDGPAPTERAERPERPRLGRTGGLRISLADRTDPVSHLDRPSRGDLFHRSAPPDRSEPFSRGDRTERSEPPGRDDRLDRSEPFSRGDRTERSEPTGHGDRTEASDLSSRDGHPERSDRLGGGDRLDRSEPLGRGDRTDPGDLSSRGERPDRSSRSDLLGRADRGERGDGVDLPEPGVRSPALSATALRPAEPRGGDWRDPLAAFGAELARGADAELPGVAAHTELGELAHRLALPAAARRALVALYSLYLVGEPAISLARLAHALGDWTEPLGQGELGALAMLRRRGGKVGLRGSVTDLLDGVGPRAIRMIGTAAAIAHPGAARLARDGRSDAAIEIELASRLGRIAVIEGGAALALLEARLHGATAVALIPPLTRPLPWPRDAGLVVVAEPAAPAWVAALPALTAA